MTSPIAPAKLTPSQTIGPFYWGTLVKTCRADLAPPGVAGERIDLALSLHDVAGALVPDGLIEIWQANSHGRYNHPDDRRNLPLDAGFDGFGRASTDTKGVARFATVKPGRVPWPEGGLQAPHVNVSIFARGVLNRLATRVYFDGDPGLNEDPVLKLVEPARRATLIAKHDNGVWHLPIHLGGPHETVFFDV
jgi:protocatechuate 3,4-dioxygenase, alpha subunit